MKTFAYLLVYLFLSTSLANAQETVYLFFDSTSEEICDIPKEQQGRYHGVKRTKKYEKTIKKNGEIDFYICRELFQFNKLNAIDTCSIESFKKSNFSKIEDLIAIANNKNPLYPSKAFDKIYIVERNSHDQLIKYDVKWQYYIE